MYLIIDNLTQDRVSQAQRIILKLIDGISALRYDLGDHLLGDLPEILLLYELDDLLRLHPLFLLK